MTAIKIKLILLFAFLLQPVFAQEFTVPHIKTVTISVGDSKTFIAPLGYEINISFDDLQADGKDYYYKIQHCTQHWKPSTMGTTEFVNGFAEGSIVNFENSFNSLQGYTHFKFKIPNENTRFNRSGNYLLSVYDSNTDSTVFARKLVVYQPKVDVGVSVFKSRVVQDIQKKQSVQLVINHPKLTINNPNQEIAVVVFQNYDWNFSITNLKPQYLRTNQMLYKYDTETSFWAGNEFLYFDTKAIRVNSSTIQYVALKDSLFNTYLYPTIARSSFPYTYNPDINGSYVVRTLDGENHDTDGDYSWVHFTLKPVQPIEADSIYVYGRFNNYELNESTRMKYDTVFDVYQTKILFKQGFFNYTYAAVKNGKINTHLVEGSFFQTENIYTALVYYKPFEARWYAVIGMGQGSANQLQN